jgi:hypothetical protein
MSAFPLARGGGEHEELEASEAPHQLAQGAGARAVRAELAMNCRQEREDRGELARQNARLSARRAEEEFGAGARIADPVDELFQAVHGATLRAPAASAERRAPLARCD